MSIKDKVLSEIAHIPHSPGRVPYTYHHDFVRQRLYDKGLSRSDVAKMPASEDELYACCYLQILTDIPYEDAVMYGVNIGTVRECIAIAKSHVQNLIGVL